MSDAVVVFNLVDNGGRRYGIERRHFSYSGHVPERRCGEDRRKTQDRRNAIDRREDNDRRGRRVARAGQAQVVSLEYIRNGGERRLSADRRDGMDRRDFVVF